jgi:hypothetical protein
MFNEQLAAPPCEMVRIEARATPDKRQWLVAISLLAFVFFLARSQQLFQDPDTFWHLATGSWILGHWSFPSGDVFSHTMPGATWVMFEWLAQILLAGLHGVTGWPGVAVIWTFSATAAIALLANHLLRYVNGVLAASVSLLAILVLNHHFLARPHVLAWPLLVLWASGVLKAADERLPPSMYLVPLMTLWANTHASYAVGLGLAGFLTLEAVIASRAAAGRWAIFLAASTGAALLTPDAFENLFRVLGMHSKAVQLANINEWAPAVFGGYNPIEIWLFSFLAFCFLNGFRFPAIRILFFLLLVHMAFSHVRHAALLVFLGPMLVARSVMAQLSSSVRTTFPAALISNRRMLAGVVAVAMVVLAVLVFDRSPDWRPPPSHAPAEALHTARSAGVQGKVLNDYDFGGYLIFAGVPTFIDGRSELFGDNFMKTYVDAVGSTAPLALREVLDKHGVTWTLLRPVRKGVAVLDQLPGWRRLYSDANAVVHVREGPIAAPAS